jgi:DNA-directed RNA polymerase specialized sigma24 family protein
MQYLPEVKRLSGKSRFARAHVEPAEFVNDVLVMAVSRFELYDPTRGQPKQWLFMLAMAVTKKHDKTWRRRMESEPIETEDETTELAAPLWGRTSAHHVEVLAQVAQLLRRADPLQRAACETVLEEMDQPAIRASLGISGHGRNFRLKTLRNQVSAQP